MIELLATMKLLGAALGIWTVVSVAGALVILPWFRSQARANALMSLEQRQADWLEACCPARPRG